MPGFIRSASLTGFAAVARRHGIDPERALREFALPRHCLDDPDVMVPIESVRRLLESAAERTGVDSFGLEMAEARRTGSLGPLGLLVREQPTLRQATEALARYARSMNEALFLTLEEAGDVVVLREELIIGGSGPVRQSTELAIGVAFSMLRAFLGPAWKPRRVCFAHHAPADRSVHERFFGGKVEFGHDFNGVVCARGDLDAPNPDADPTMAQYARKLLEETAATKTASLADEVHRLVVMQLGGGRCTIDRVAHSLGVDRRTVHRRLGGEGRTFSAIVDDVRRDFAERYLKDGGRTLAEVSALLGFAAPSAFSRWYRRQFGRTASQERGSARRKAR